MERPSDGDREALLSTLRSAARKSMCDDVRRRGLPGSFVEVRKLASRHLIGSARAIRMNLRAEELNRASRSLAMWLRDNHDPSKSREPARTSRADRAIVNAKVVRESLEAEQSGVPLSVRELAARHGLTPSRVQRARMSHKSKEMTLAGELSAMARRVLAVIQVNAPVDGKRAFDRDELFEVAGVDEQAWQGVADEINQAKVSAHLLQTEIVSGFGSRWIVVSRGRKLPERTLLAWLANAEARRVAGNRRRERPDQKKYCVNLVPPTRGLVERDLWCAVAVLREGSRNLATWRHFVEVSLPSRTEDNRPVDREALVTVVQSIFRLDKDVRELLPVAAGWPILTALKKVAPDIIRQIEELWTFSDSHGEVDLLCQWAMLVRYREHIEDGSLPGRSVARFHSLVADEDLDLDQIFLDGRGEA